MIFHRSLKSYRIEVTYEDLTQIVTIVSRSRRQAIRAAKQLWEPYLENYDTDWTKTKKQIKYRVNNVRKIEE